MKGNGTGTSKSGALDSIEKHTGSNMHPIPTQNCCLMIHTNTNGGVVKPRLLTQTHEGEDTGRAAQAVKPTHTKFGMNERRLGSNEKHAAANKQK